MQIPQVFSAISTPPAWLVSNGRVTVGPVPTELLLRGVLHGRVPSDSLVREVGWNGWRELNEIREICALQRSLARVTDEPPSTRPSLIESADVVADAADAGEVLLLALHAAVRATSATVGLAHRLREPLLLPTTSCVFEAPTEVLGEVLPWFDPAFARARAGELVLGLADGGVAERTLGARLGGGHPLRGVAMLPITTAGRLIAMLELGRSDRPFRSTDAAEFSAFALRVGATLSRLRRSLPGTSGSGP